MITSQRGSAWHCYIGRWLSKGKHAFFRLSPRKNQWKFWNHFWHRWLRWWDLQTRQIWLRSVHRGRLHTVVKYHTFVTYVLPFFFFCPFPHLAYRSQFWTDSHAWWLKRRLLFRTRAFWGFRALKFTFRGSPAQKTPKFRPVFGLGRFAAEISLALELSRVNYP